MSGVPAGVDVLALQKLLAWLCAMLRHPVPAELEAIQHPASVPSAGGFMEAVSGYLQAS